MVNGVVLFSYSWITHHIFQCKKENGFQVWMNTSNEIQIMRKQKEYGKRENHVILQKEMLSLGTPYLYNN